MKAKFFFALLLALALALSVTPAFAQGRGGNGNVCFGGNSTIESGETIDGLAIFGCNATVKSGATVNGGTVVFGGNLTVENGAHMIGDVAVFGGAVDIAGDVSGDVAIAGGSVHLDSTAVVNGSVRVVGGGVSQSEGATVRGGITRENNIRINPGVGRVFVTPFMNQFNGAELAGLGLLRSIITAIALAALGALVVVFLPQPTQRVMATAQNQLAPSFGVGCLTLILLPVLLVALAITIIGIPVTVILAIVAAAAWIFGWIAIGYLAGERILEALKVREIAPVLAVIVGVFILAVIGAVPCLGGLIALLIGTLGVGAVVLTRFGTRPYPFQPALVPVGALPPAPMAPTGPVQPSAPVAPPPTPPPPTPKSDVGSPGTGEAQN